MFWDSSAVVPLLVAEVSSSAAAAILLEDKEMTMWWATPLECQSALHRRHRDSPLPADVTSAAAERLRAIVEHADTVAPTDEVRRRAGRLVSVHPLRGSSRRLRRSALTAVAVGRIYCARPGILALILAGLVSFSPPASSVTV